MSLSKCQLRYYGFLDVDRGNFQPAHREKRSYSISKSGRSTQDHQTKFAFIFIGLGWLVDHDSRTPTLVRASVTAVPCPGVTIDVFCDWIDAIGLKRGSAWRWGDGQGEGCP
jgi:hypothetical protein